jgi:hypothetical protein
MDRNISSKTKSNRKKQLDRIKRASETLRRKALHTKKIKRIKRIESGIAVASFTVHRNKHIFMKELARRKQRERGFFIDGFYNEALREYLSEKDIPKRLIKPSRMKVSLQMNAETMKLLDDCARIAIKQERPTAAVIEEAITAYLKKPENYLGSAFEERNPEQYESIA